MGETDPGPREEEAGDRHLVEQEGIVERCGNAQGGECGEQTGLQPSRPAQEHETGDDGEGEAAAHVVGFTGVEQLGQEGIELAFQRELQGKDGSREVVKDPHLLVTVLAWAVTTVLLIA